MNAPTSKNPFLTPKTHQFVDELEAQNAPPIYTLSPQEARKVLLNAQSQLKTKPVADIEDIALPVGPTGKVDVRLVRPKEKSGPLPMIFYIHGGGWILGDKMTHDRLIRELAIGAKAAVAFPAFSPAPEQQFPTQLEELYAALLHLVDKANEYGIDHNRIVLVGDSVGGNMATALCMILKQRKPDESPKIAMQFLFYPVTDASFETESYKAFADGPWLAREGMKWFWNAYAPEDKQKSDILASPLRASLGDLNGLPPAFIITAENDVLRDEGEAYAQKLMDAGVPTTAVRYRGTIHDFVMLDALAESTPTRGAIAQCIMTLHNLFY